MVKYLCKSKQFNFSDISRPRHSPPIPPKQKPPLPITLSPKKVPSLPNLPCTQNKTPADNFFLPKGTSDVETTLEEEEEELPPPPLPEESPSKVIFVQYIYS